MLSGPLHKSHIIFQSENLSTFTHYTCIWQDSTYVPQREKTCLQGLRTTKAQTTRAD